MVTFSGLKFARKIPIFTISGQEPVSLRTASITAGDVTRAEAGTVRFFSENPWKRSLPMAASLTPRLGVVISSDSTGNSAHFVTVAVALALSSTS